MSKAKPKTHPALRQFKVWQKALLFYAIFLLFYGLSKVATGMPLALIIATNESNFQHYKAAFFCYLIASLIEYLVFRKRISAEQGFLYSRMAAAVFIPWMVFLLWYLAPAVIGKWPRELYEIIWSNLITIAVAFSTVVLERGMMEIHFSRELKLVLWTLFIASITLYIIFTFQLPWADVFVEPNWR